MPEQDPFVGVLVNFAHALRSAGMAVGTGDVLTYCAAMAPLDPSDLLDLYWAGRATLVRRRDNIATYDEVFRTFFLGSCHVRPRIRLPSELREEYVQGSPVRHRI